MRSSNGGGADAAERVGEVLGDRPLDLADEAQGQVQLLVVLPAEVGAVVHRVDQQVADVLGRADGDEQAVHGAHLADSPLRNTSSHVIGGINHERGSVGQFDEECAAFARFSMRWTGRSRSVPNPGKMEASKHAKPEPESANRNPQRDV